MEARGGPALGVTYVTVVEVDNGWLERYTSISWSEWPTGEGAEVLVRIEIVSGDDRLDAMSTDMADMDASKLADLLGELATGQPCQSDACPACDRDALQWEALFLIAELSGWDGTVEPSRWARYMVPHTGTIAHVEAVRRVDRGRHVR